MTNNGHQAFAGAYASINNNLRNNHQEHQQQLQMISVSPRLQSNNNSNSTSSNAAVAAANPRKKKQQQPKLISTKQKQQQQQDYQKSSYEGSENITQSNIDSNPTRSQLLQQQLSQTQSLNMQGMKSDQSLDQNIHSYKSDTQKRESNMHSLNSQSKHQQHQQQQISLNSNANMFAFDIRQFHPMSPQIHSFTTNHLKTKANELESRGVATPSQILLSDQKKDQKKQSNHRRNQSKSQYTVPSSLILKGLVSCEQEQINGASGIGINSGSVLVNSNTVQDDQMPLNMLLGPNDNSHYQREITQNKQKLPKISLYDQEEAVSTHESRNLRLRFNSVKSETLDMKSLEKIKKQSLIAGGIPGNTNGHEKFVVANGIGGGESTDDVTSNKQLSQYKLGYSDKESMGNYVNNKALLKYTPNSKKEEYPQDSDLKFKQFSVKSTPFLDNQQLMQKRVQFEEDSDADDDENPSSPGEQEDEFTSDVENRVEVLNNHNKAMKVNHNNSSGNNKKRRRNYDSDYDDEEEELKEEVGELPPKIEDLEVEDYEEDGGFKFGQGVMQGNNEDEDANNDAPTVVIDSSLDEKDYAEEFRRMNSNSDFKKSGQSDNHVNNIAAALRSIKLQEEDEIKNKKKKVTIMSVEEEEALISQINEIRDRIKRGETIGQQQQQQPNRAQIQEERLFYSSRQKEDLGLQAHFKSVDDVYTYHNIYSSQQQQQQTGAINSRANEDNIQRNSQSPNQVQKPPLYSLTFAHPDDPDAENDKNPLNGTQYKQGFHSIDNNIPMNCIIMDGPNIFEKKKQRFERIQKMRNTAPNDQFINSEQLSNKQRSRDDITPINGMSSSISANITTSQKKSLDSGSNKGGSASIANKKASKQLQNATTKSKKVTSNQKLKSQQIKANQKSRQSAQINQVIGGPLLSLSNHQFQNHPTQSITDGLYILNPMQLISLDDAMSNGSHSIKRMSKNPKITINSGQYNDTQINLYSLKKVSNNDKEKVTRQTNQGTIKKKLLHKSKKIPFSASQPPTISEGNSHLKNKNLTNNLLINVTQEPVLALSSSIKRLKTPKIKLKDDLLHQTGEINFNPKRLSEFQSVSSYKLPGGSSVKNNQSSYRNPFFQTLSIHNRAAALCETKSGGEGSQGRHADKRVSSNSFNKIKAMNTAQNHQTQQLLYSQHQPQQQQPQVGNNNSKSKSQVMCNIEPSFLQKLIKAKQETDNAFEAIKKKSTQSKFSHQNTGISNTATTITPGAHGQTGNMVQQTNEKSGFLEFEKKYRKLSGLINKIFS